MKAQRLFPATLLMVMVVIAGCGGGGMGTADFSLQAGPSTLTVTPGGAAQTLSVFAAGTNGFKGNISVTLTGLPAGVTATPASLTLTTGALGQFTITASSSAVAGSANLTVTGTSGNLTHNATSALTIAEAVSTVSLSTTSFDFGDALVNQTLTQTAVVVTNNGPSPVSLDPTLSGDPSYSINTSLSCGAQLAAGANCDMVVNYAPTTASAPATQNTTLNLGLGNVADGTPQTVAITGTSGALAAGVVTATDNPQVALYTMTLPFPGSMMVNFGTTTSYGLQTWSQSTPAAGGTVSIFVAGMLASTQYHMQATITLADGTTETDVDHTFTTGAIPANLQAAITTTTTQGMTPQPGVEVLDVLNGTPTGVLVSDLSGNILWTYANPGNPSLNFIDGVTQLPDGDFLMAIGANSTNAIHGASPIGTINEIREVDLGGDTVKEISIDDLNTELANASCTECKVTVYTFHHDLTVLPNGHWLVVANTTENLSPTSTPPLTNEPAQSVLGDVIIELDQNLHPVWAWNEFNHLDPNRHPWMFPDWTHTNAILYSPSDGNIIVSMRHQNWVVKVNYADGAGDGSILWRLGEGGDFTLVGGTDPTDWQYAQHGPNYFSTNTAGVFSLGMVDNGDDRITPTVPAGTNCGGTGDACYSTIPVFQIDEGAKTATLTFHQILPATLYTYFGGNAEEMANGDVEYDICGLAAGSQIFEVTQDSSAQTVWNLKVTATHIFRGFRIPSLYPGVQW